MPKQAVQYQRPELMAVLASWQDVVDHWLEVLEVARRRSPATLTFYRWTLDHFLPFMEKRGVSPATITGRDVLALQSAKSRQGLKVRTLHDIMRGVRALLFFACREGYMEAMPVFDMPKVPEDHPHFLESEEDDVPRLLAACVGPTAVRDRGLLLVALASGLRRKELCLLSWGDVTPRGEEGARLHVRDGKGGRARFAYIGAEALKALEDYRQLLPEVDPSWPVFLSGLDRDGRPIALSGSGLSQIFRRMGKRAGLRATPHAMRHTCGRRLASDLPLPDVQRLLGHSQLTTTARYCSPTDAQVERDYLRTYGNGHKPKRRAG